MKSKDQQNQAPQPQDKAPQVKRSTKPLNVATDIVAGVLVGCFTGVSLDKWLSTKPIFLIICLILGVVASFRMIWREMK